MENTVKKPKKLDRRQIRTKRRIREALMALVMEKPVEKITIKELAETLTGRPSTSTTAPSGRSWRRCSRSCWGSWRR